MKPVLGLGCATHAEVLAVAPATPQGQEGETPHTFTPQVNHVTERFFLHGLRTDVFQICWGEKKKKIKMETMHELIPFAKEMLSQKPNRKMVKLYVLGSVLAFFGVVIGLVETVCSPFTSEGRRGGGGGGEETGPNARANASSETGGFDLGKEQAASGDAEGPGDQTARLLRAPRPERCLLSNQAQETLLSCRTWWWFQQEERRVG
ncbi:G0/G1 switch protein 2 [Grus japonensis]|uniref:G0/G1 switch protein 2 n=1 Tax=Grus japonensis TaxID=30415 RepID=A0ABC9XR49_GRUJA